MRHLISDTARIAAATGYAPQVDLATGIRRYIDWIRAQMDVREYFSAAEELLRAKGIVHKIASAADASAAADSSAATRRAR